MNKLIAFFKEWVYQLFHRPKFKLGEFVQVYHPTCGNWQGYILMVNNTGDGIEYEVSNAPGYLAGMGFLPYVWESEIKPIKKLK